MLRARSRPPVDVLGLPDKGRDALMAAALGSPQRALTAWRRWQRSGADSRTDPVALRWLPLIGQNLEKVTLDTATRMLFREARHGAWASNVRMIEAARPALDALNAAGIRTLLLKGAALTRTVCNAPGLRPFGDVDVLVEPHHAMAALRLLGDLGWRPLRGIATRDLLLTHSLNLRKPPYGALDVHWYLLAECCWPKVDLGIWRRAQPLPSFEPAMLVLSPADQLLHLCLHGLRWSPVHAGHWVADAACVLGHARGAVDWGAFVEEAARRRMGTQLFQAMRVVRLWTPELVPAAVLDTLARLPVAWYERWECRLKGRPVVSPGGLFVIWTGWLRTRRAARAEGAESPPWCRYLAAALGVESPSAVVWRFAYHARHQLVDTLRRRPRRGTTTRERLPDHEEQTC